MIRFEPDSFFEGLMRPFAIAAPDGGVYVEIIAPDFRLAFAIIMFALGSVLAWSKLRDRRPVLLLLATTALAFVPWLLTSGNGRYFMAFLLMAGPLCVGCVTLVPATRAFKLALVGGLVLWQGYLLYDIPPWRSWTQVDWRRTDPFPIELPPDVAATPQVFVTLSTITYSIVAPRFHPDSRWVNIAAVANQDLGAPDARRAHAVIDSKLPLNVIFPTVPGGQQGMRLDPRLALTIDQMLAPQKLSIDDHERCRLLPSEGMKGFVSRGGMEADPSMIHGFWLCPAARHANPAAQRITVVPQISEQVFRKLEGLCPRIFRPGEAASLRLPDGAVRAYGGSDFRLYVQDSGEVWYKYYRALQPVHLGDVHEVLSPGFSIDCEHVVGRGGLPWNRGI